MNTLIRAVILSTALAFAPPAIAADLTDLQDEITVRDLANGTKLVRLIFDMDSWDKGETFTIRHFCPPGVEMHSQGFAVVDRPDIPMATNLRRFVALTNARNLAGKAGEHGFSWYLVNNGPDAGPFRLEISFIAKPRPPAAN